MKQELIDQLEQYKIGVVQMDEATLYFAIDTIGGLLWRENHEHFHGRLDGVSTEDFWQNQEYGQALQKLNIEQMSRFGIDPESAKDRPNGDYWKWYYFWKNWSESLSDEQIHEINHHMEVETSYAHLLPTAKWNDGM